MLLNSASVFSDLTLLLNREVVQFCTVVFHMGGTLAVLIVN